MIGPETDSESIVHLRVSVARMEGMLTQALTDQGARLTKAEADLVVVHGRLGDKGKLLATHTEQIASNRTRIEDLENRNDGQGARALAILAGVVGVASLVVQFTPIGN
jgi:hypothetical protein